MRRFLLLPVSLLLSCHSSVEGDSVTPPIEDPACPAGPVFTTSPIDPDQIDEIIGIGQFGAPGHVIPNEHGGIFVKGEGVPLHAPADGRITTLRRTKYLASTFRPGELDHAITFRPCASRESVFGHVTSLSEDLDALITGGECQTYSTDHETVEACSVRISLQVRAGKVLGTVGGPSAKGVDWGHHDAAHTNHFANPSRVTDAVLHTVCPYDDYAPTLRATLLDKMKRKTEPRCGTVELDVDGTAQGLWVDAAHPTTQSGDERAFVTLGPQFDNPDTTLRLAVAPAALGGQERDVPVAHSGRKNRAFDEVTADGTVYCYAPFADDASFLLSLAPSGELRIERIEHGSGASPCNAEPSSWTLSPAAMTLVR